MGLAMLVLKKLVHTYFYILAKRRFYKAWGVWLFWLFGPVQQKIDTQCCGRFLLISLRNWELPKWEPKNWARNTENFKNWENIFTEFFLADDSKSSKTQNLQIWEILKLRFHKLGFTRLWELWITFHSNCEKNKTEKPKTTILSHQECKLEIKILSEKPFLSNFMKIQSGNLTFRRDF